MTEDFRDFVERLRQAGTSEDVWANTLEFFRGKGAQRVSYRHFQGDPEADFNPTIYHDGFPKDFAERFFAERLYLDNPLAIIAARTTDPFYWSDVESMAKLSEADRCYLDMLKEEVPGDGMILQVFGPECRNGTVNVGFGENEERLNSIDLREFQMAVQAAHLAYCRLTPLTEDEEDLGLTARELEVLEWIARGKSNSVIADILGISVHTVDTHVRRVFRKLDVNDRTTAAVKGFGVGLLQPAA